jgi:hypothetical protein
MTEPDNKPLPSGVRARTIALLYACFAGLWIVLSDAGLRSIGFPEWLLLELEVYKGCSTSCCAGTSPRRWRPLRHHPWP